MKRCLIWVEGIIGCGKTTFAREVGKRLNLRVIEEPVSSNPYLGKFYEDPKRWAFPMQIHLLHERFRLQKLANAEASGVGGYQGAILDRSISGDRVFAGLHTKYNNITEVEMKTYELAHASMCESLQSGTHLIYLDVQPETAYNRMKERNRSEEVKVSIDYLKDLRAGYESLLKEIGTGLLPWSHTIRQTRLIWDPTSAMPDWESVSRTVRDFCL